MLCQAVNILEGWGILRHDSNLNHFLYRSKTIWEIRFQDTWLSDIKYFWNLIFHFDCLISLFPDFIQKCVSTPDGAKNATFQMKYALHVCSRRDFAKTNCHFFWTSRKTLQIPQHSRARIIVRWTLICVYVLPGWYFPR